MPDLQFPVAHTTNHMTSSPKPALTQPSHSTTTAHRLAPPEPHPLPSRLPPPPYFYMVSQTHNITNLTVPHSHKLTRDHHPVPSGEQNKHPSPPPAAVRGQVTSHHTLCNVLSIRFPSHRPPTEGLGISSQKWNSRHGIGNGMEGSSHITPLPCPGNIETAWVAHIPARAALA